MDGMASTIRRDDEPLRSGYASGSRAPPQNAKKRAVSSKYDIHKVKVWLGDKRDHYYILSRFLISRSLTITKIPSTKAIKIALELKKHLVDNDKLNVSQDELEATLFSLMREKGYGQAYIDCYRTVSEFYQLRQPLVIILCGAPCTGKSTIAQQLAARLNMPNVMQTDVICELMRRGTGGALPPQPPWARNAGPGDLCAAPKAPAPAAAAAAAPGPAFRSSVDPATAGNVIANVSGQDTCNEAAAGTSPAPDGAAGRDVDRALRREVSMSRPGAGADAVSSLDAWLLSEFQSECRLVRRALQGDFNKALNDGKPLIVEGVHLDPSQLLKELQDLGIVILPVDPTPATPYGSNRSEQRSPPPQLLSMGSGMDSGDMATGLGRVEDAEHGGGGGSARCSSLSVQAALSTSGPAPARGWDLDGSPRGKRPSPLGKPLPESLAAAGEEESLGSAAVAAAAAAADAEMVKDPPPKQQAEQQQPGEHHQHLTARLCHKHVSWGRVAAENARWYADGGAAEDEAEAEKDRSPLEGTEGEEEGTGVDGGDRADVEAAEGRRGGSWRRRRRAAGARGAATAAAASTAAAAPPPQRRKPQSPAWQCPACLPPSSKQARENLVSKLADPYDAAPEAAGAEPCTGERSSAVRPSVSRGPSAGSLPSTAGVGPLPAAGEGEEQRHHQGGGLGRVRVRVRCPTAAAQEQSSPCGDGLDEQDSPDRNRWGGASSHGGSSPRASTYNLDDGASDVNFGDADTDGAVSGSGSPLRGSSPPPPTVSSGSPPDDAMRPIRRAKSHPVISRIVDNHEGGGQDEEQAPEGEQERPEGAAAKGAGDHVATAAVATVSGGGSAFGAGQMPQGGLRADVKAGQAPDRAIAGEPAAGGGGASGAGAAAAGSGLPSFKAMDRARSHHSMLSGMAGWHPGAATATTAAASHGHPLPGQPAATPGGFVRNCSLSTMDLHTVRNSLAGILRMGSVVHGSRLTPSPRPNRAPSAGRMGSSCGATPSTGGSPSTLSRVFSQAAREHLAVERLRQQQQLQTTSTASEQQQQQQQQPQHQHQEEQPQQSAGVQETQETQQQQHLSEPWQGDRNGDAVARVVVSDAAQGPTAAAAEASCSTPLPQTRAHLVAVARSEAEVDAESTSSQQPQPEPVTPPPPTALIATGGGPAAAAPSGVSGGGATGSLPPLFVPVVLRMSEADHRLALEDNTAVYDRGGGGDSARATASGEVPLLKGQGQGQVPGQGEQDAPGPEEVLRRAQTIQQYLCSFEGQGMPVVDVTYGNFGEALDVLHEYVLMCIQTAMEQLYESRSGELDAAAASGAAAQ